jgi:hypothetical protein
MKDFTLNAYRGIIEAFLKNGYSFQTFANFLKNPKEKSIILRHDVDAKPNNSLKFAQIQYELGISGTYYFRVVPQSLEIEILKRISSLNHEIGYHYENMSACGGDLERGKIDFEQNLQMFRGYTQIETICMHGSPISSIDNKELWKHVDYKDYELIGEPYFDLDFSRIAYLTDTGRSWNGAKYSMRDSVVKNWAKGLKINNSDELIQRIESGNFPKQAMLTFHPQRWTDNKLAWAKELVFQTTKNKLKYILRKIRSTT